MSLRAVHRSLTTRQGLCLTLALSLLGGPAVAAVPPGPSDSDSASIPSADTGTDSATADNKPGTDSASTDTATPTSTEPNPDAATSEPNPELTLETEKPESSAGIGGNVISSEDPEASRARADLEGTALLENTSSDVPERLRPMQRAAWWTMFGAFALASTGGVFSGLAEVQEDRALRIVSTIDIESGGAFLYEDKQAEYQDLLDTGARQAGIARGFLIGAGITLVAGVTLFIVDHKRSKKSAKRAQIRPAGGGLEVRF